MVLESINPTIGAGVLRDDESNGEGLMPEFQGRNSKFSDGDTLKNYLKPIRAGQQFTHSDNELFCAVDCIGKRLGF